MKFKKGVKVEVMNQSEVPISWRVAEILSGDGHTYVLRFDSLGESESPVQRVHRSLIRPSPPLGQHTERWLPGDILEVFDDCSWKVAIIVQTLKEDYYFVRFVGSSHEFCIHISSMRRRLAWQDGRWNWVPKVPTECGKVKSHELSNPVCYRNTRFPVPQPDSLDKFQGDTGEESHILPSRSRKRAFLHCSSTTESHTAHSQDLLALETNSSKQTVVQETLLEKVDDVSYPRETLAKKQMCASFNIRLTGYNKMHSCCFSPLNDSDSGVSCSVGSCSVTSESQAEFPFHFVPSALCSDAESVCCSRDEEEVYSSPHRREEDVAESIHRLELCAYRSTLEALYASGPLSWEQETMLTNLRITLHISNDDHLLELKNLISAKSCKYYVRQ